MTDITLFPDATAEAMAYIRAHFPGTTIRLTADESWEWEDTLITVSDTGGRGEWTTVWGAEYSDAQITIDVSNPDAVVASRIARTIHALIKVWPSNNPIIHSVESLRKPVYYPNPSPFTPNYEMTFSVTLTGTKTTI